MKIITYALAVIAAPFLAMTSQAQTSLVGSGSSYGSIFSPADTLTYTVPGGGLLSLTLSNGSTTDSSGIWNLTAQGGANASIAIIGLLNSGAQTQLTGSQLKFNVDNDNNSLLGLLGTGASIHYAWEADATFNTPGSVLNYTPDTNYHLSFDVNGNNGLLSTVAGLTPKFQVELVDGAGNPLNNATYGTLINIAGLLGTGVPTGTVNLDYTVSGTPPSGPIGIKFIGDATVGATALSLGTNYATISNLSLTASPVPEPSGGLLIAAVGSICLLRRHRHHRMA